MITVLARDADLAVVKEFFELFKTPWQLHAGGRPSQVLLCDGTEIPETEANLVLVYGAEEASIDRELGLKVEKTGSGRVLSHELGLLPIYGPSTCFRDATSAGLTEVLSGQCAATVIRRDGRVLVRLGYDLFREVRHLLTVGQTPGHASFPTLDLHISILRETLLAHGIRLVEIPPIPAGHAFTVCLTHDVDHPSLRNHCCDHTMFGFVQRAVLGSVVNVRKRRLRWRQLLTNWLAVLRTPLVYLGLARDFWLTFDRYLDIERGLPSTFFFIPWKDDPGLDDRGIRREKRAAKYDVGDFEPDLRKMIALGHEVGVHGLDAWRDSAKGVLERERIARLTGCAELGIRMHWLFFDEGAHARLEAAGYTYDSTVGYNGAIGFRAGTAQVFQPIGAARILELPMHVMDTALFYPAHLNLGPEQAKSLVGDVITQVRRFGGALTVNWHDRSIAPERLWDRFYIELLNDLRREEAWFASAAQAVAWFRARRSVVFDTVVDEPTQTKVSLRFQPPDSTLPRLKLRVHRPAVGARSPGPSSSYADLDLSRSGEYQLAA